MRYLSVCSGIEAATVAWHPLGWTPVAFSEIEPFPAAVLAHHYPNVPNYGDMTKHKEWPLGPGSIDLLVGGTPCQSFSVAGLRKGISDPRGGLMLTYLEIAQRLRPRWLVWENVPGVLSSGGGRDFGSFLGALGELRYGWAYRVIDAQYCRVDGRWPKAVPQRRRRVFVVGCDLERDPRGRERAAEVLALGTGLRWHLAESGKTRKAAPSDAEAGVGAGCWWDGGGCAGTLTKQNAGGAQRMPDKDNFGAVLQPVAVDVADSLVASNNQTTGFQTEVCAQPVGFCWQNNDLGLKQDSVTAALRSSAGSSGFHEMNHPVVVQQPVPFTKSKRAQSVTDDETWVDGKVNPTLSLFDQGDTRATTVAVAFASNLSTRGGDVYDNGVSPTVRTGSGLGIPSPPAVAQAMTVRRLTPKEAERLQAFPDDYTLIPWRKKPAAECPDGPRYKALGNSMAVNCMAWIGERIAAVEANNGAASAPPSPPTPGTGGTAS